MRFVLSLGFILSSCATRYEVPRDYSTQIRRESTRESKRTVVFFLIDGMSFQALMPQLENNRLLNLKAHFLGNAQPVWTAHSIFPSLTFPNLSSLLREKPIHKTGALGNKVISNGRLLDFENLADIDGFAQMIKGNNVFTRLAEKGQRTVSFDYGLGLDATFHSALIDLNAGIAFSNKDYLYLDQKKIESLRILLSQEKPQYWPDFIFIHLVGVDFLSHIHGPKSKEVANYLVALDQSLSEVFKLLKDSESSGHETVSIMTADHGFSPKLTKMVKVEKLVAALDPKLKVINEVRFALVYNPQNPTQAQKQEWAEKLVKSGKVEIVSYRHENQVRILSKSKDFKFEYLPNVQCPEQSMGFSIGNASSALCPSKLVESLNNLFYPHFIENLAYFFQAEKHPDLLLIPHPNTSFAVVQGGYHGGPTLLETRVPLLMRNARLANPTSVPALSELLRFF